ncbi:MAG: SGNH/GDSL hydrolase family protein [Pseudomonadota bacterium]
MSQLKACGLVLLCFLSFASQAKDKSVIYIGDSHSSVSWGLFARIFEGETSLKEFSVDFAQGVCGAGIHYYLRGDLRTSCGFMEASRGMIDYRQAGHSVLIDDVLGSSDIVFVQLGGNHWENPRGAIPLARALVNKVLDSGAKCIWIGTASADARRCPRSRQQRRQVNEALKEALSRTNREDRLSCDYIDSFSLTDFEGALDISNDCRHYTSRGYRQWSEIILPELVKRSFDLVELQ